ncbi:HNH endonuclease signature motif containing protein [Chloroflexota bacterium]
MGKMTCELCGCNSGLEIIEKHHIVPLEFTEMTGIAESKVVELCRNCLRDLNRWYSFKVTDMVYDTDIKRFRTKSWLEMVKEYETAYSSFTEYRKR